MKLVMKQEIEFAELRAQASEWARSKTPHPLQNMAAQDVGRIRLFETNAAHYVLALINVCEDYALQIRKLEGG